MPPLDLTQIKSAVAESLTEFKDAQKAQLDGIEQSVKSVVDRVEKIEKLPLNQRLFNINTTPKTYLGYNLEKQLAKVRNIAARHPGEFDVFSSDEKSMEFAKFFLMLIKANRKTPDIQAQADLHEYYQKTNQMQEGTNSEGGYLVPDEFFSDIIKLARSRTFALRECTVIPMNSDTMYIPTELTKAAVAWTAEETAATAGEPTFGRVQLTAKRLDGYARVTNELLEDSSIDIVGMLAEQFGYAVDEELDNQVLNGTGDPCSGVLTSAAGTDVKFGSTKTNFSEITADDVSQAIYALEGNYGDGAMFVLNRIGMHYMRTLADDNGQKIFAQPGGSVPGTIWEYPYFVSHKITNTSAAETAFAAVGNFKYFIIGRRKGSMGLAIDPYGLFLENATRFKIVTRWGLAIGQSAAFARILTATS